MRKIWCAALLATIAVSPVLAQRDGDLLTAEPTIGAPVEISQTAQRGGGERRGGDRDGIGREGSGFRERREVQDRSGFRERSEIQDRGGFRERSEIQDRATPPVQPQAPRIEAPRGEARSDGNGGGRTWPGGRTWRGGRGGDITASNPAPIQNQQAQNPQAQDDRRFRGGEGRRDRDNGRSFDNRDARNQTPPNQTFDRNRDGRVDPRFDRNRNGVVDRRFDNDRDGNLDRRFDRNRDGNIDRRFDRNRDGRFDQRYGNNDRSWDREWRGNRRYNWQGYRNQYSQYYRQPRYYNPYGDRYGYQRFGIGIYLNSLFFGSRYWINDPYEYRLPAAPYGYRWIRYYNDVLLVNERNGYVVDVINNFFW